METGGQAFEESGKGEWKSWVVRRILGLLFPTNTVGYLKGWSLISGVHCFSCTDT